MTSEEIVRGLEHCLGGDVDCEGCPYAIYHASDCDEILKKDTLDLIRRQQQEIDRLKSLVNDKQEIIADLEWTLENECLKYSELKAEAIKEFATRLKANRPHLNTGEQVFYIRPEAVDELVKEMVGADNGKG